MLTKEQEEAVGAIKERLDAVPCGKPCEGGIHIAVAPASAGIDLIRAFARGTDAERRAMSVRLFGEEETARAEEEAKKANGK